MDGSLPHIRYIAISVDSNHGVCVRIDLRLREERGWLHMKQAHNKHMTQKRSRFVCPMSEYAKSFFFHATQLTKHMKEHKVDVGRLQKKKKKKWSSM